MTEADLVHMLASCVKIRGYWDRILATMNEITGLSTIWAPSLILLGQDETGQPVSPLLFIALCVGRIVLTSDWVRKDAPTYQQWSNRFFACFHQERSLFRCKGRKSLVKGQKIWGTLDAWLDGLNNSI